MNKSEIIDICGKRILEYISESLAKLNRGIDNLIIRAIGGNISKGIELAYFLYKNFGVEICKQEIKSFKIAGIETPCIEITLNGNTLQNDPNPQDYIFHESIKFVDFPVYHLLLDWLIYREKKLEICKHDGTPLITIVEEDGRRKYKREIEKDGNEKIFYGIKDVFYRCGILWPSKWKDIAKKLSEFDDVILGVDTNILYDCIISEHLLPALSLIEPNEYVHTPNWMLIIIPSAVMHELEESTNIRDKGFLQVEGRMGFRALKEIIELTQSIDITGISLLIVGEANPVLDTRVEIQGLREDFCKRGQKAIYNEANFHEELLPIPHSRKSSSGDMIIRDQFKNFLQRLNFHKGAYFLTEDKSNAALAQAEGLHTIYFHFQTSYYEKNSEFEAHEIEENNGEIIKIAVPIGKIVYEMAVQFGTIGIKFCDEVIKVQCDAKGENLEYWIYSNLRIEKEDFDKISKKYGGKLSLKKVANIWKGLSQKFISIGEI